MLLVPNGGGLLNVSVVPTTEYAFGGCTIPEIITNTELAVAGAIVIINEVVEPLPEKVSTKNAVFVG